MTIRRTTTARNNRVRLGVHALEAREVPAVILDLTHTGDEATANGAILRQSGPVATASEFDRFLRLKNDGSERGFNTDFRPFQMDQKGGHGVTHALKLSTIPTVVVDGVAYREFLLDVRQKQNDPLISLDQLRIFTGNNRFLNGYNSGSNTLGGKSAVFNLDGDDNVSVVLNGRLNAGQLQGDAVVLIPASVFGGDTYVFLFSKFSGANKGAEEWAVRKGAPVAQTGSLSGLVYADINGNGTFDPLGIPGDPTEEYILSGATVQLQVMDAQGVWNVVATATSDQFGNYSFSGLAAGTYTLAVETPAGFDPGLVSEYTVTLGVGQNGTGFNFGVFQHIQEN